MITLPFDLDKFWVDVGNNSCDQSAINSEHHSYCWLESGSQLLLADLNINIKKHIALFCNKEDESIHNLLIESDYIELVNKVRLLGKIDW